MHMDTSFKNLVLAFSAGLIIAILFTNLPLAPAWGIIIAMVAFVVLANRLFPSIIYDLASSPSNMDLWKAFLLLTFICGTLIVFYVLSTNWVVAPYLAFAWVGYLTAIVLGAVIFILVASVYA